jgi:diaminohydroxyphosphoribosylaminopyrimidine deaminase / 5-amino-6-(5-phosphoribosylamino)uracil reductase
MPKMTLDPYMHRCLELAALGFPDVMPNPAVGCVIVCDDRIIGEGFHQKFGGPHAEVNALQSVKDKNLLEKATVYVNLEPCSHHGKTPPCADLLINSKVKKVVVAIIDPNPLVAGQGIEKLKTAGIEVNVGNLIEEAAELNKRFLTFYQKKRPYIILKWAQTTDGFIADEIGNSKWISNETSRLLVHKWRSEEQAILVGTNTAKTDNPYLTTRNWPGRNPLRIVIDKDLLLPENLYLFDHEVPTIVFNAKRNAEEPNLTYVQIDFGKKMLPELLDKLYELKIQSVLIEGGTYTLQQFIDQNLWDEARVFTGEKSFGKGIAAPQFKAKPISKRMIKGDLLEVFRNKS